MDNADYNIWLGDRQESFKVHVVGGERRIRARFLASTAFPAPGRGLHGAAVAQYNDEP
jgi:hypothetical protein